MSKEKTSFWTTLPGILTGLASIITAAGGLIVVLKGNESTSNPPAIAQPVIAQTTEMNGNKNSDVKHPSVQAQKNAPLNNIVDCSSSRFQSNNSVRSLLSWSDPYFQSARSAAENNGSKLFYNCQKALQFRASAWCKQPSGEVEQGLRAALRVCRVNGSLTAWYNGG